MHLHVHFAVWVMNVHMCRLYMLYLSQLESLCFWYNVMQDALDRGRHTASTFKLLAKAAAVTSLAEIVVFASTGSTSGMLRELWSVAVFASYLMQPKSA